MTIEIGTLISIGVILVGVVIYIIRQEGEIKLIKAEVVHLNNKSQKFEDTLEMLKEDLASIKENITVIATTLKIKAGRK